MKKKPLALIVDDDESILMVLSHLLGDMGIKVETLSEGKGVTKLLAKGSYDLALLDINIPGKSGLKILSEATENNIDTAIIIMTAEQTMNNTLTAMKHGAFDYISKPFDLVEVEIIIEKALTNARLREKVVTLEERLKERLSEETTFIGSSKAIENIFKNVGKVAPTDVTVLIEGESGTGKELLAHLLHSNSPRSQGPFVAVNTAAVPGELMESELFGYEKGAFTGASEQRAGKFELADNGTLFLDEVGDTSLELQTRLLRAIQEREFYRIGGKAPITVDTRIIAATNQNLEKAVEEGRFREDLYYRLNVVKLNVPPLRDRKGDITLLAEHFLATFPSDMDVPHKRLSEAALKEMAGYTWPGNVRELENVLRRAALLSPGIVLAPDDLQLPANRRKKRSLSDIITEELTSFIEKTHDEGSQELYDTVMPIMEKPLIRLVLKKTRGNQVHASELLGINRNTLRKKIRELNIDLSEFKG